MPPEDNQQDNQQPQMPDDTAVDQAQPGQQFTPQTQQPDSVQTPVEPVQQEASQVSADPTPEQVAQSQLEHPGIEVNSGPITPETALPEEPRTPESRYEQPTVEPEAQTSSETQPPVEVTEPVSDQVETEAAPAEVDQPQTEVAPESPAADVPVAPISNEQTAVESQATQTAPVTEPQTQAEPAVVAGLPSDKKPKKTILIAVVAILVAIIVAAGGYTVFTKFFGSAPSYSNLSEVTVKGYESTDSGMKFKVPEQFTTDDDGEQSVTYSDYIDDNAKEEGKIYAEVAASVESMFADELSDEDIGQIFDQVESLANDPEQLTATLNSETFKDVKLASYNFNDDQNTARVEITGNTQDGEETVPGKIVLTLKVSESGYLYSFGISAPDYVWNKNTDIFEEMIASVQVDQPAQ
jgi:hypothetical protein